MKSNSFCNHTSDLQNRSTAEQESDLFNHEYDLQTELDDTKFYFQLIITITKFEKKCRQRKICCRFMTIFQNCEKGDFKM